MSQRRELPAELQQLAVQMVVDDGRPADTVASELGVEESVIQRWTRDDGPDSTSIAAENAPAHELHVAPDGAGAEFTSSAPGSLAGAQAKARSLALEMHQNIAIVLHDGRYELAKPITLTAADSGRNGHRVFWRADEGAAPVLSGGHVVGGWECTDAERHLWSATVPADFDLRQLYVDGVRARRARSSEVLANGSELIENGFRIPGSDLQRIRYPEEVEFVFHTLDWMEQRCGVATISGDEHETIVTMKQPGWDVLQGWVHKPSLPYRIENAMEFLTEPGHFYLERSAGRLHYLPRSSEDMTTATVIAPALEQVLVGSGTPESPVRDITIDGLTFSHSTWLRPNGPDGFPEIQFNLYNPDIESAKNLEHEPHFVTPESGETWLDYPWGSALEMAPAAVDFSGAREIHLLHNTFSHLGAAGLGLHSGSQHNRVLANSFYDISGNGLQIGSVRRPNEPDPERLDCGNEIRNNVVHHVAAEYSGAIAMFFGYVSETTIAHNEIFDLPYAGIGIGWGWGSFDTLPTTSRRNRVLRNAIYDVMQTMNDGAAIYALGPQPEGVIAGNYIRNVNGNLDDESSRYRMSIYLDQGSAYWTVRGNVIENALYWFDNNANKYDPLEIFVTNNYTDCESTWGWAVGQLRMVDNFVVPTSLLPVSLQRAAGVEGPFRERLGLEAKVPPIPPPAPGRPFVDSFAQIPFLRWESDARATEISGYEVYCDGRLIGVSDATTYRLRNGPGKGTRHYSVRARTRSGGLSPSSLFATVAPATGTNSDGP